jgi:hypothetical protein
VHGSTHLRSESDALSSNDLTPGNDGQLEEWKCYLATLAYHVTKQEADSCDTNLNFVGRYWLALAAWLIHLWDQIGTPASAMPSPMDLKASLPCEFARNLMSRHRHYTTM